MNIDVDIIRDMRLGGRRKEAEQLLLKFRHNVNLEKEMARIDFKEQNQRKRKEMNLCRVESCTRQRINGATTCKYHRDLFKSYKSKNRNI